MRSNDILNGEIVNLFSGIIYLLIFHSFAKMATSSKDFFVCEKINGLLRKIAFPSFTVLMLRAPSGFRDSRCYWCLTDARDWY